MTPAAPTGAVADVNATDPATPPQDAQNSNPVPVGGAADTTQPSPSTRGAEPGSARSAEVAAVFDELAPVHDRLATLLSLGLDRRWRSAAVAEAWLTSGDSAIDVAAGTGRLAAELADRVGPFGRIVAVDLSPAMVDRGAARARDIVQLEFVLADALALPYDDGRFGAATIAFGLGTLADPAAGLRELRRVVRPGGRVVCLEPTMPTPRWWGRIQHRAARRIAPLAVSVAARRDAYRRLTELVRNVPDADSLADLMGATGLVDVEYRRLGLGAVALHSGTVPPGRGAA
ncbi:MAG TPA: ubiquinone/menaquinone biosynthesis methyltransferase [Candidatus Limnocylindrales bacterium]|nr:ubiquinone/menaquinone biosynthesis methyltransferase [Candidatus Limnocylindrales bacterium]